MRRIARRALALLALGVLLAGCGGEAPYAVEDARTLLDAGLFDSGMAPVESHLAALLYGVEEETIQACVCYMSANTAASADELTVLILTDEDAARAAETACQRRIEAQIQDFRNYTPAVVPRLEAAVIRRIGNTVLLAVGDPERLPAAVDGLH